MPRSSAKLNMGVARAFFQTATEPGRMTLLLDVLMSKVPADIKIAGALRECGPEGMGQAMPPDVLQPIVKVLTDPDTREVEKIAKATQAAHSLNGLDITRADKVSSALCENFNSLWGLALTTKTGKRPCSHFAMIHDDIEPRRDVFWLDVLMDEMRRTGADVMSAVSPIKDPLGKTSTAVGDADNAWDNRRLMIKELAAPIVMDESGSPIGKSESDEPERPRLPETFGIDELVEWDPTLEGKCLLMNTGLWLADLSKPWVNDVCFETCQRLTIGDDGARHSWFAPEDWLFARQLAHWGAKVMATTKVPLIHWGDAAPWPCPGEWGNETDEEFTAHLAADVPPPEQPECIRRVAVC